MAEGSPLRPLRLCENRRLKKKTYFSPRRKGAKWRHLFLKDHKTELQTIFWSEKNGKSDRGHCAGSVIGPASKAGNRARQIRRIGTAAPIAARGGRGSGQVRRRRIRLVRGLSRPGRNRTSDRRSAGAILS